MVRGCPRASEAGAPAGLPEGGDNCTTGRRDGDEEALLPVLVPERVLRIAPAWAVEGFEAAATTAGREEGGMGRAGEPVLTSAEFGDREDVAPMPGRARAR